MFRRLLLFKSLMQDVSNSKQFEFEATVQITRVVRVVVVVVVAVIVVNIPIKKLFFRLLGYHDKLHITNSYDFFQFKLLN